MRGLTRPALALAGLLLAWSLVPVAWLLLDVARDGGVLTGSNGWLAGTDQQVFLNWIRQSGEHLLIANHFRLGPTDAVYVHPVALVSGVLWKLGLGLRTALLLWKPVAALALGAGIWAYVARLLAPGRQRVAAALVGAFFFSPVLPLLDLARAAPGGSDGLFLQFDSGETMQALGLWGYEYAALAIGLMALFLAGVETAASGTPRRRTLAWMAVAGALVGWIHPWQGATIVAVLIGLAAWGRLARAYWPLALPAAATVGGMAFPFLASRSDADWRTFADQNAGAHGPLWAFAAALLPLLVPALAGVRGRPASDRERVLVLWPAAALAVYAATTDFPPHALQGISIPLAVLAVRGLERLRLGSVAVAAAVVVLTVPGAAFVVKTFRDSRRSAASPYVLTADENDAIEYLSHAERRGGVLARYRLGGVVVGLTKRQAWIGHFAWTPRFADRRRRADDLFSGRLDAAAARRMVAAIRPAYLLADCASPPTFEVALRPLLLRERRFGCVRVLEVQKTAQ